MFLAFAASAVFAFLSNGDAESRIYTFLLVFGIACATSFFIG